MLENSQPYTISNEGNITEILEHFDSQYIFDIIEDKLSNINYSISLPEPNIVASFEENFKLMRDKYPGDDANINSIRTQVYTDIVTLLCKHFNLRYNFLDENIDIYTSAYYAYEFLVCNRNNIMINFFTSFIINNKDSLYNALNLDALKKNKDSSTIYNKRIYEDQKYLVISANIEKVLNYISELDITLVNIFQSTYINVELVQLLDTAFADCGNFFKNYYCNILRMPDVLPVVITNVRLQLQKIVGTVNNNSIEDLLNMNKEGEK